VDGLRAGPVGRQAQSLLTGATDQSGGGGDDGQPQCFGDEPHGELALTGVLAQPLGVAKLADHVPVATAAGANGGLQPTVGDQMIVVEPPRHAHDILR
jgi:hypothetical protein